MDNNYHYMHELGVQVVDPSRSIIGPVGAIGTPGQVGVDYNPVITTTNGTGISIDVSNIPMGYDPYVYYPRTSGQMLNFSTMGSVSDIESVFGQKFVKMFYIITGQALYGYADSLNTNEFLVWAYSNSLTLCKAKAAIYELESSIINAVSPFTGDPGIRMSQFGDITEKEYRETMSIVDAVLWENLLIGRSDRPEYYIKPEDMKKISYSISLLKGALAYFISNQTTNAILGMELLATFKQ